MPHMIQWGQAQIRKQLLPLKVKKSDTSPSCGSLLPCSNKNKNFHILEYAKFQSFKVQCGGLCRWAHKAGFLKLVYLSTKVFCKI